MSTMPRQIPDSECKQGKCACTTTGCWDQCSLKQFPVNFVGLAFPVAPLIPAPEQPEGMPVGQEPKYGIRDNRLYNRASGEFIPTDEPVFIMRARDLKCKKHIAEYGLDCPDAEHRRAVKNRVGDFTLFALDHPDRMKYPDTEATPPAVTAKPDRTQPADHAPRPEPGSPVDAGAAPVEQASAEPLYVGLPPPVLTWLYTHCRAIGMTCKSLSGKWEDDIALFTINLTNELKEAKAALASIPPLQAPEPAPESVRDAARLDWLDKNIFHREMDAFDKRQYQGFTMWVTFAPNGTQGSARKIIDAAIAQEKAQ